MKQPASKSLLLFEIIIAVHHNTSSSVNAVYQQPQFNNRT